MEELQQTLREALVGWGPSVIAALATLILGWLAARLVRAGVRRAMRRADVDETLTRFVGSLVYMAALVLVVIATLGRLGVNTTSSAAAITAAGLAVGLAFQDSLSNFAAGVLLIVFRPFQVGDYVEAGGVSGIVDEIQIFTTVLNTPDNKRVIVGNSAVMGDAITNYSANDTRRVDLVFGVGYEDDLLRTKQVLERILKEDDRVLEEPAATVAVSELADSSVNFAVRPWVATADYWDVAFAVTEQVKQTFDAEGLSIPFPQTDVHLHREAA